MGIWENIKGHFRIEFVGIAACFVLWSCGPKNFHENLDYANTDSQSVEQEAAITNPNSQSSNSFVTNNTVALIQNYNVKNRQYFGICSGVRLSDTVIITAAHCIGNIETMRVVFGSSIQTALNDPRNIFEIQNVKIHEGYRATSLRLQKRFFDVALIRLKRSLPRPPETQLIARQYSTNDKRGRLDFIFNHELNPYVASQPVIAGYGVFYSKFANSQTRQMQIGQLNEASVQLLNYNFTEPILYLTSLSTSQACLGDSGGPLFSFVGEDYYLQGIAISIKDTAKSDPFSKESLCEKESAYLNLDLFKNWIITNMQLLNNSF